jgi:signal transduction histidine kinase
VVSIKDNGLGMSEETRRKIFDPFFTTKEVGEGTGLGLSIVLGIVNEHNGHVDVKTGNEDGTEFLIYLPTTPESILRRKAAHEH